MNWNATKQEEQFITTIMKMLPKHANNINTRMDIIAVHLNICPLDLKAMAESAPFSVIHDVGGIVRNLNRKTIKLENNFVPRFSKGAKK